MIHRLYFRSYAGKPDPIEMKAPEKSLLLRRRWIQNVNECQFVSA